MEMFISWFSSALVDNAIALVAMLVAIIAAYYAYSRAKAAKQTLSLNAFMKTLEELGKTEARDFRRYIFRNRRIFPDFTKLTGDKMKEWNAKMKKGKEISFWVKNGKTLEPRTISLKRLKIDSESRKAFEEVAVRADRIGFMFFVLNLSEDLRQSYLCWLCNMYCNIWNRVAPYVQLERKYRLEENEPKDDSEKPSNQYFFSPTGFTPYFERLVYKAYDYYKNENKSKKPRLIFLTEDCTFESYDTCIK